MCASIGIPVTAVLAYCKTKQEVDDYCKKCLPRNLSNLTHCPSKRNIFQGRASRSNIKRSSILKNKDWKKYSERIGILKTSKSTTHSVLKPNQSSYTKLAIQKKKKTFFSDTKLCNCKPPLMASLKCTLTIPSKNVREISPSPPDPDTPFGIIRPPTPPIQHLCSPSPDETDTPSVSFQAIGTEDAASEDSGIQSPKDEPPTIELVAPGEQVNPESLLQDDRKRKKVIHSQDSNCACSDCLHADLSTALEKLEVYDSDEERHKQKEKKSVKKTSSLKSSKTPPGEIHKRKVVRFADAFGFDLETVRQVFNLDTPPVIPKSAIANLDLAPDISPSELEIRNESSTAKTIIELYAAFLMPGHAPDFMSNVWNKKVCLESIVINYLTITGIIRVANLSFNKHVFVRYSLNNWNSYFDVNAHYIPHSSSANTDKFSFAIFAPGSFQDNQKIEFCICYEAGDKGQFWDNNNQKNYVLRGVSKSIFL